MKEFKQIDKYINDQNLDTIHHNNNSNTSSFGLNEDISANNMRSSLNKNNIVKKKKEKEKIIYYKPKYGKLGVEFKKDLILKNHEKLFPIIELSSPTNVNNFNNNNFNNNTIIDTTIMKNVNKNYLSESKYIYENATTARVTYKDLELKKKYLKEISLVTYL